MPKRKASSFERFESEVHSGGGSQSSNAGRIEGKKQTRQHENTSTPKGFKRKLKNEDVEPNKKVCDDSSRGSELPRDTMSSPFEPSLPQGFEEYVHQRTSGIRHGSGGQILSWSRRERKRLLMLRAMLVPYETIRQDWFPNRTANALMNQWSRMTKELIDPQARVILVPKSCKVQFKARTSHSTGSASSKPDHGEGSFGQQKRAARPQNTTRTVHSKSNDTNTGIPSKANIITERETHQDLNRTGTGQSRDIPEDEAGFPPTVDDILSDSANSTFNEPHLGGNVMPEPVRNDGPEEPPPPYAEGVRSQVASSRPEEPHRFKTGEPRVHEPEMPFPDGGPRYRTDKTKSPWGREMEDEIIVRLQSGMRRWETLRAIRELGFGRTYSAIMGRIGEVIVALGWQIKAGWSNKMQDQLTEAIDNGDNLLEIRNRLFPKLTIIELHRRVRKARPIRRNSSYDDGKRDEVHDEVPMNVGEEPRNENSGEITDNDGDLSFVESGDDDSSDKDYCDENSGQEDFVDEFLSDDGHDSEDGSPGNRHTGPEEEVQSHAPTFPATQSPAFEQLHRSTAVIPQPSTKTANSQCHDTEQTHPHGGSAAEALEFDASSDQEGEKTGSAQQSGSDFDKPSTEPTPMFGASSTARPPLQGLKNQAGRPMRAASHNPEGTYTHSAFPEAWAALEAGTATLGQEAISPAWNRVDEADSDSTGEESEEE